MKSDTGYVSFLDVHWKLEVSLEKGVRCVDVDITRVGFEFWEKRRRGSYATRKHNHLDSQQHLNSGGGDSESTGTAGLFLLCPFLLALYFRRRQDLEDFYV